MSWESSWGAGLGFVQLFFRREGLQAFVSLLILFLAVGSLVLNISLQKTIGNIRAFNGEKCTLMGMIEDEPLWRDDDVVFPLRPEKLVLEGKEHSVSGTVRVVLRLKDFQWGGGTDDSERGESAEKDKRNTEDQENKTGDADLYFLSYGQKVSLEGMLYEPQGKRNPGGFGYRAFLETQGVAATFYGAAKDTVHLGLSPELSCLRRVALQLKEKMSAILRAYLPEKEGNLLVGMLFGERRALDPEVESFFARSGVAHLIPT
jgi:predicted membrane metal-binding protein